MKWKCKNGMLIEVSEMGTDHLEKTIAMLRRKGFVTHDEFFSCAACSGIAGEYAALAAEAELLNMKPWSGLAVLEAELAQRQKKGAPGAGGSDEAA